MPSTSKVRDETSKIIARSLPDGSRPVGEVGSSEVGPSEGAPPQTVALEIIAKLQLRLSSPLPAGGKVQVQTRQFPAGKRIYLKYDGTLRFRPDMDMVDMTIGTGCDWALVRNDGCLVLDARLSASTPVDGSGNSSHIAISLNGLANLGELYGYEPGDPCAYENWIADLPPQNSSMKVALSMRVEVSTAAEPNAALRYREVAKNYEKYVWLGRRVLVGAGDIAVATATAQVNREIGYLESMNVDISRIEP